MDSLKNLTQKKNRIAVKKKIPASDSCLTRGPMKGGVVPPGIEPGTHGFSVRCSTN